MLDIIRNLVSSIFGKILLAIMVLSFALWGVGDILSSGNSQLAAKVGKEKITLDEFYLEFQETVRDYNQNTGSNINLKEAHENKLHSFLLQELIYSKMINDYAKKKNLLINEESLKNVITKLPEFQDNKKMFSRTKYKTFILNNFSSEEIFLKEIENQIYQGLLFENFNVGNFMNESIIDMLYNYEGEKRTISYFLMNKDHIKVDINDQLLKDYYKKNEFNYREPEKIIVDVIKIDIDNFKNQQNINDDDIEIYYQNNIAQYTKEESRDIQFIRFSNAATAADFYEVISNSDDDKLKNYMIENNLKFSTLNNFMGDTFNENITDQIFKLNLGQLSNPINYEDVGFYIFKVININKKKVRELDLVKDEIANYLALDAAYEDFDDALNIADEMLLNDYSFAEISKAQINPEIIKNIELKELNSEIQENIILASDKMPIGYISEVIMNENIAYIYKVNDKLKSYIPELPEIRNKVEKDFINDQKQINQVKMIKDILDDLSFENYKKFEEYALNKNHKINTLNKISRSNSDLNYETLEKAFKLKALEPFMVLNNDGLLGVGVVTEIIKPKDQITNEFYNSVENNVNNNFNSSLEQIIGSEIIEKSSYEIYNKNIDQLFM